MDNDTAKKLNDKFSKNIVTHFYNEAIIDHFDILDLFDDFMIKKYENGEMKIGVISKNNDVGIDITEKVRNDGIVEKYYNLYG